MSCIKLIYVKVDRILQKSGSGGSGYCVCNTGNIPSYKKRAAPQYGAALTMAWPIVNYLAAATVSTAVAAAAVSTAAAAVSTATAAAVSTAAAVVSTASVFSPEPQEARNPIARMARIFFIFFVFKKFD
jgi:hypothetical protein